MRDRLKAFAAFLVASMLLAGVFGCGLKSGGPNAAVDVDYPQAMLLLEDDFFFIVGNQQDEQGKPNSTLTGWIVDATGGTIECYVDRGLILVDDSSSDDIQIQKEFVKQEKTLLTIEFNFKLQSKMDGTSFQLLSGKYPVLKIGTSGSSFGYCKSDGSFVSLWKYRTNIRYGVKLIVDLKAHKYDFYLDGKLLSEGLPFFKDMDTADSFMVKTSVFDRGNLFFEAIRIHKGYYVYDSLLSVPEGDLPDGWTSGGGGIVGVSTSTGSGARNMSSYHLVNTAGGDKTTLSKSFDRTSQKTVAELMFRSKEATDGTAVKLMDKSKTAMELAVDGRKLCWRNESGELVPLTHKNAFGEDITMTYVPNTWYIVKAIIAPKEGRADLYINYKKVLEGARITAGAIDGIQFETSDAANTDLWVDEIFIYPYTEIPDDYVDEPSVPEKNTDAQIGMQFFPGWRVGTHVSWDPSYRLPILDLYLGKFDEGNTEAWDWQIKWMVEHGTDFFFIDWYQCYNRDVNDPLMKPLYNYSLEGYFYCKYSNYLKFAIQTFGPFYSYKDYVDNIIPYWINYYFTDPRYEVIDNKPLIGIGEPSTWIRTLGGPQKASELMDYIEEECKKLGFDGAYFIATTTREHYQLDASGESLNNLAEAGFDGVYEYTFGTSDISLMQTMMTRQQEMVSAKDSRCANLSVIPTISVGWSTEGCFPTIQVTPLTNKNVSTEDFNKLCGWVKDFSENVLPPSSLGKKLILIDNWNEYTEGHSLNPGPRVDFAYLDSLGKHFTKTEDFSSLNTKPTFAQQLRMNLGFPKTWNGGHQWNFDSLYNEPEFWTAGLGIGRYMSDGKGYLKGMISTIVDYSDKEAYIQSTENLNMSADAAKVMISLKNSNELIGAKLYFTTTDSPEFSEDKSIGFAIRPFDQCYTEYVIDASQNASWKGTIKQLRIRFLADGKSVEGDFSFDYIRVGLTSDTPPTAALGEDLGRQQIPFSYEFLEPVDPFDNPQYVVEEGEQGDDIVISLSGTVKGSDSGPLTGYTMALDSFANKVGIGADGGFTIREIRSGYHTLYLYDKAGKFASKLSFSLEAGAATTAAGTTLTILRTSDKAVLDLTLSNGKLVISNFR